MSGVGGIDRVGYLDKDEDEDIGIRIVEGWTDWEGADEEFVGFVM